MTTDPFPKTPDEAVIEAERQHATLNRRLSAYREQGRRLRPEFTKAYDDLVARLTMLDRGAIGPRVGEPLPDFHLPDERGTVVSSPALLRDGPLVVSFNRGHWCPYCRLELRSLASIHDRVRALGAHVVSIMPDSAQFTSAFSAKNELPFPVLSDIDLGYALSLDLVFWVGDEIRRLYEDVGIGLERYHGNGGHFLPIAAKYIVGRDGRIKARQVNVEFRERMEPAEIIAVLESMAR